MLDVKWIRENPEAFLKGLKDRGFDGPTKTLNQILKLDEERRETIQVLQDAQARRNAASKDIGKAKQAKNEAEAKRLLDEVAGLKDAIQDGEDKERTLDQALRDLLAGIPNMPAADVPVGEDERENVELRKVGAPPKFDFEPKQHFEIGEALGMMDFETAAKLSGARFVVLKGPLARLERALAQFMLDLHTTEHGYTEINPPLLVRDDTMFGTAQLPKFEDDQFRAGEDFWLIPTAEVPLTNLVREDITDEAKLPDARDRRHAVLPRRGGRRGQGHARHDPPASVPEGRARLGDHARAVGRRARAHDQMRRDRAAEARPAVSRGGAVHRRHGLRRPEDLRHRGLAAGAGHCTARFPPARPAATSRPAA